MNLTDDQLLRAADAVRQFRNSDGMTALTELLERERGAAITLMSRSADSVTHVAYAEMAGRVQTVEKVFMMFDKILKEAGKLEHE